jgi:hypothetical protein
LSEEEGCKKPNEDVGDPKAKFREALEKKKQLKGIRNISSSRNSKICGDQVGSGAPKIFRRRSGSV